jgi:hypothetical protein
MLWRWNTGFLGHLKLWNEAIVMCSYFVSATGRFVPAHALETFKLLLREAADLRLFIEKYKTR